MPIQARLSKVMYILQRKSSNPETTNVFILVLNIYFMSNFNRRTQTATSGVDKCTGMIRLAEVCKFPLYRLLRQQLEVSNVSVFIFLSIKNNLQHVSDCR